MEELTNNEAVNYEMFLRGCCSGRLNEWPILKIALRKLGHSFDESEYIFNIRDEVEKLRRVNMKEHIKDIEKELKPNMVAEFYGISLEDYTKEELIVIIRWMGKRMDFK